MSLILRESTGGNDTAPPVPQDSAVRLHFPRRKGDTPNVGTAPLLRANFTRSGLTFVDLGELMSALTANNFSTPAVTPAHLGYPTHATTTFGVSGPSLGSSFGAFGVCNNASGNYFLTRSGGGTVCYTEAPASTALSFGTEGSGGVSMAVGTLTAGLYVTIEESPSETTNSNFIAEHSVDEQVATPAVLIDTLLPPRGTFDLS